jgi:hypothetical protein
MAHLAEPIITDAHDSIPTWLALVRLMESRSEEGTRTPTVVVVVDELADLLMVAGDDVQRVLTRLTQRGREAGIHVVAATQKPTTAVIGSLVKANFPVRLVGRVMSIDDARVAAGISGTGAERLTGRGDFLAVAEGRVIRFQSSYVTPREVREVAGRLGGEQLVGGVLTPHHSGGPASILPVVEPPIPEVDQDLADAQRLTASTLWSERHHPDRPGDYRWGFISSACQFLYGQALVGNWHHRTTKVIQLAESLGDPQDSTTSNGETHPGADQTGEEPAAGDRSSRFYAQRDFAAAGIAALPPQGTGEMLAPTQPYTDNEALLLLFSITCAGAGLLLLGTR